MVHIKACSNVFSCHNLLRCIFEDDKVYTSPCLYHTCKTDFDRIWNCKHFVCKLGQTFLDIKNGKEKFHLKLTLREKLWQEIGYEMAGLERNWGPDINTPTRV